MISSSGFWQHDRLSLDIAWIFGIHEMRFFVLRFGEHMVRNLFSYKYIREIMHFECKLKKEKALSNSSDLYAVQKNIERARGNPF